MPKGVEHKMGAEKYPHLRFFFANKPLYLLRVGGAQDAVWPEDQKKQ